MASQSVRNRYKPMLYRIIAVILLAATTSLVLAGSRPGSSLLAHALDSHAERLMLKDADLPAIEDGQIIVRPLPGRNSNEMSGLGVLMTSAPVQSLVESFQSLDAFRGSPGIIACGRFQAVPQIKDIEDLPIDARDITALLRSRPGQSDVKLSAAEIESLRRFRSSAPSTPEFRAKLADRFRQMLLERARQYSIKGDAALAEYADKQQTANPRQALDELLTEQEKSAGHCPDVYAELERYPRNKEESSRQFLYWAVQKMGDLKPVINLVHVLIHSDGDHFYIVSKQVYSSHYSNAAVAVMELIPVRTDTEGLRTLIAYSIRLEVDMFGGPFGFFNRKMAQSRMLGAMRNSLNRLRVNIEGGLSKEVPAGRE